VLQLLSCKNLGACGDGGAVVTNDLKVADAVRILRDHGSPRKYEHVLLATIAVLDSLQAAVLPDQAPAFERRNEMRRRHAQTYIELLSHITGM